MAETDRRFHFRDPVVNVYVRDVELRLGSFTLGLASTEAVKAIHGLPLDPGLPRSEIALWTDDVDEVVRVLHGAGVRVISEPHTFIGTVRAAWLLDPEGNHVQVVCRVGTSMMAGSTRR